MAEGLIGGAVLGVLFQETYKGGAHIYKVFKGSARKEFEENVKRLLPTIREICETSPGAPSTLSLEKYQRFQDNIIEGNRLVDECQKSCICVRSLKVAKRVKKLQKDINKFILIDVPLIETEILKRFEKSVSAQLETVIRGQNSHSTQLEIVIDGQNFQSTQLRQNFHSTQFEAVINRQQSHSTQLETVIQGQNSHSSQLESVIHWQNSHSTQLETLIQGQNSGSTQLEAVINGHHSHSTQVGAVIQGQNSHSIQLESVIHGQNSHSTQLETLIHGQNSHSSQLENVLRRVEQQQHTQISQQDESNPPDPPGCLVGFDEHIREVKELVLGDEVNVIGVIAMGGAGKSTLAKAVCYHNDIKERLRVIYLMVSESPDLLSILKTMWRNIVGGPAPDFRNIEDAHNKLEFQIKSRRNDPILVVLDDIWKFSDLKELLFRGEQYTTLVTTRDKKTIPTWFKTRLYPLPCLQEEHALQLFCCCAFRMPTIPNSHSAKLVKQVQAECKGLPLALQVIGSSLYGMPDSVWKAAKDALARGEAADDNQIEVLLKSLETSINVLDDNEKQCFLDLAIFPKGRTIPANLLLDIWVYVRQMRRNEAVLRLWKFVARHLLDLRRDPWTPESTDDCMNSYSFSQHDVMRDLALYLAKQDNRTHCRRLYMSQKESELPQEWQTDGDRSSRAQIVSINTGAMKDTQWPGIKFPEAEALVLYFTASEYCIPTFLDTMSKLKVLIIHNDNAKRAKISGLTGFKELSQLKTLHLERLIVPPLYEDCKGLKSLQKISLSLCQGLGKNKMFNLPSLLEFNLDHCSDLEELSSGICSSSSLEILSVTHCHSLAKLPADLGNLRSLKEIRLCQSPGLKTLPPSICSLGKLELLNISSCMGLKVDGLKVSDLKTTFQSLAQMASLKKVICDEDNEQLFRRSAKSDLEVVPVVEDFNLNWLC
ncbi:hypothetical protein SUGI_0902460 [Cryptomeria japonica]|uniref:probable disease resistance protein At4g33300 n=1 Tax=Cryptomeria japonica TaxID=3369 RepID=UPI0024149EB2|nr:probable disease resistance protein At4g33300 [Cryptomeria japonica]GLJ43432.1 hypothetical protein SUGI_0902460 [Cryptomeria japonica]